MDTLRNQFTEAQVETLRQAVARVESKTSGEVVPMVVGRSDSYPGVVWKFSLGMTLAGAAVTALIFPHLEAVWVALTLPVWAVLGRVVGAWPALERMLAGTETMAEEVHQRASQAFLELDLSSTRGRSGVLVFFSLLEHRMEIIADRGIYEKVNRDVWVQTVQESTERARKEGVVAGVLHAVEGVGRILAEHFPRDASDQNQIPDRVVILDE